MLPYPELSFFFQQLFGPLKALWFVAGACVGSFISVVVHRLPLMLESYERREEPLVSLSLPPSYCPCCNKPLAVRDNLPLVGYLLNKGRCRQCGTRIPQKYFWLEFTAGFWGLAATFLWSSPALVLAWSIFGWYLLTMAWMDAETRWLPDVLTLGLLWLGLLFASLTAGPLTPAQAVVQVGITYVGVSLFSTGFTFLRGQVGIAGGDLKLIAALAAWFAWPSLLYAVTLAFALFVVQALLARTTKELPFGPALCASAAVWAVWGAPPIRQFL